MTRLAELRRAAVGANGVSVDPKTGIYPITFFDKAAADRTDTGAA